MQAENRSPSWLWRPVRLGGGTALITTVANQYVRTRVGHQVPCVPALGFTASQDMGLMDSCVFREA